MQRIHIHVRVADLSRSIDFYQNLFDQEPNVRKGDYAKWMLEDPRLNFAISHSDGNQGVDHIGVQAESMEELAAIQARLQRAGEQMADQPNAECCYAKSSKTWVRDPDSVAWETFVTHGEIAHYGEDLVPRPSAKASEGKCCA